MTAGIGSAVPELAHIYDITITENELLSFTVYATDTDTTATIVYSAENLPAGATLDMTTGVFSWTPGAGTAGSYIVKFIATANGETDEETILITVLAVNKSNLVTAILAANVKVATAVAGTGIGQYPQSAIDAFRAAIAAAQAVADNPDATNAEVSQAVTNLKAAETTFDAAKITTGDQTPPAPVKYLSESIVGSSWIKWTWTNPADADFAYVRVYIDGELRGDVSGNYFIATGLSEGNIHTISIQTIDSDGNINPTLVSDSATTSTVGGETVNLELVRNLGGNVGAVAASENYAYVGRGHDFVVLDISDISNPVELGRLITQSFINKITISGNYAYTVDNDNTLAIIDISTSSSPKLIGRYNLAGYANDIVVLSNYAYVISSVYSADDYHDRLDIVDISTPSSPKSIGIYNFAGSIKGIAVSGNYVYVTNTVQLDTSYTTESDFQILDVSVPSSPKLAGRYDLTYGGDVSVSGNYAYVADSSDGILIFDVSSPSFPKLISICSGYADKVVIEGNYVYLMGGWDLEVVDISNPLFPKSMGSCDTTVWSYDLVVEGNYAYVSAGSNGFVIVNVSNPSSPTIGLVYDIACDISDIVVSGNYAYVADGDNGLEIFEITDSSTLKYVSRFHSGYTSGVIVSGNYAYISESMDSGTMYSYLVIIDISDPLSPKLAGYYEGIESVIAVSGNYAYVHDLSLESGGLGIVDVSSPSSPKLVGSFSGSDVAVSGNYAYATSIVYLDGAYQTYLEIVDISNPSSPKHIGSYGPVDSTIETANVAVSGNYVYLANGIYGLEIVDVSNPSSPTYVGSFTGPHVGGVKVFGNYAYINDFNDLKIVDISNPSSPILAGTYDTKGRVSDMSGNYVYLLDDYGSLSILRVNAGSGSVDNLPTANAGDDKSTTTGTAVTFDASASNDDKGIASYSWDFDASNGITSESTEMTATKTYTIAGIYTVTLTVTDTIGQISSDTLQVVVNNPVSSISYAPLYDNRLRQLSATSVLSTTAYLDIGKSSSICRDLMLFDLSSYKTTDTISKASLSLYWYYPAGATRTSDTVVEIYRPFEWDPKYVTWNSRMSGVLWSTAGGSWFDKNGASQGTTPYASLTFPAGKVPDNKYYEFDVTQLVQEYVSGKYKNTGFFLKARTESGNYIAFYSADASNAAVRPKLTVTSTSGSTSTDSAPVANAGADKTSTVGSAVTFDASASTDDKGIASYSWDFDASNDITSEANTVSATKTYTTAGTYTVTLTVTDTIGQMSTDTLQVIVSAATTPESTVSYAPTYDNRLKESSATTVLSTTSYIDIGKTTSSYRDLMLFDLSSYKTTDTISKATLSLYWYYPAGATRTSDTIVEVYRPVEWDPKYVTWNSRMSGTPWTTAGGNWFDKNGVSQGATPYALLTFAGSKVPDNKYYEFDVTSLVQEYVSGKYKNTGFFLKAKTESGNYIAFYSNDWSNAAQRPKLTITSTSGSTPVDTAPVANAGADKTVTVGSSVTFDGSASTDDKGIASYSWDFDASNGITSEATTRTASKTYTTAGIYTVTLTVTDTIGQRSTDTLQVVVNNPIDQLPVANAGADKTATTSSAVTFDGSASTDDKGITSYSWDFDASNGITSEATGVMTAKAYTTAGTYTVTLTVTDTIGQKSSDTLQVVVSDPVSSVSYAPVYDNRLRESLPTTVLSTTAYLDIGKSSSSCRDVMLFDLSSYKTTDTISKATLSLYWYYPAGATRTSDTVVEVYRPVEWDPKYVTWNSRMSGVLWSNAGGNWYDKNGVAQGTTPYASLTFAGSKVPDNKHYEFDVTQLVQDYISGKYKNTGFFLKAKTESGNYIAFYSLESSNAAQRPKLTITR